MPKRITEEDDYARLAENMGRNFRRQIKDKASFDFIYSEYLAGQSIADDKSFRENVWEIYLSKNPSVSRRNMHKEAGGKNFPQDKRKTARTVVRTEREYRQRGADKVDLKGYDMPTVQTRRKSFTQVGKVKGKIVYGEKTVFKIHSKTITRFRDSKGRFIKV